MVVTKMWRSSLAWTSVCCVAVIVWNAERATAAILVDDLYTYATQDEYKHQVADFGHHLPKAGYFGILTAADPIDACEEIQHAPRNKSGFGWIVIVKRGGCNFDEKALRAQEQGFLGVIVYDPNSNKVEEMKGDDVADQVEILATFVGRDSGEQMLDLYCNGTFLAAIFKDPVDITYYLIPFAIIIGVCLVILLTFLIIKCSRDCMKKRQSRISREHLKKMPLHRYKKGDTYDVCAICLDDFEEGEKLRVLPCNHAYHQKCVDPWLLRKRRTCPVCKRKAIPGSDSNSYNSSDSDSVNSITYSDSSASESSPLLAHGNRATHPNNNALLDSDSSSEELQGVVVVCPSNNRTVDVAQVHTSSGSSNVAPVAGTSISVGREVVGSYGAMDFRVSHPPPAATRRPDPSGMQEYASSISSAESGEVFRVVQPSALSRSPAANSHHSINNSPPAAVNDDARSASHSPHNSSHSTSPNASNNDGNGSKLNFITKLLNRLSSDSDDGDDQDDDHTFLV